MYAHCTIVPYAKSSFYLFSSHLWRRCLFDFGRFRLYRSLLRWLISLAQVLRRREIRSEYGTQPLHILLALPLVFTLLFLLLSTCFLLVLRGDFHDAVSNFKQVLLVTGSLQSCFVWLRKSFLGLKMKFSNVDEFVFLFVFDEIQLESVCLCFDFVIWLFQVLVHGLKLVSSFLLFIIDFPVVLVLVRHLLNLCLHFRQLWVFVFDVPLTFRHILLEFVVQIDKHVFPVNDILQGIGQHLVQIFTLVSYRLSEVRKLPFPFLLDPS